MVIDSQLKQGIYEYIRVDRSGTSRGLGGMINGQHAL